MSSGSALPRRGGTSSASRPTASGAAPRRSPPPMAAAEAGVSTAGIVGTRAGTATAPAATPSFGMHIGYSPSASASASTSAATKVAPRRMPAGMQAHAAASQRLAAMRQAGDAAAAAAASVTASAGAAPRAAVPAPASSLLSSTSTRRASGAVASGAHKSRTGGPSASPPLGSPSPLPSSSPSPSPSASPPSATGSHRPRPAPSAAVIAAALQAQMMSGVRAPMPGHAGRGASTSAAAALAGAKRRATAAATSLTLAQQLGLTPAPAPKLTGDEWSAVRERARIRGDPQEPCPICTEEFKDSEQVLLSCSHVFHKVCLRNFEVFSGTKVCPICRCTAYEKQLINDAAVEWRNQCATKLQALYRGYRVRKEYRRLRELIPPQDPSKRQHFYLGKLARTSSLLAALMDSREAGLDALFAEMDRSVAAVHEGIAAAQVQLRVFSEEEWEQIRQKARRREETECPICMGGFEGTGTAGASESAATATASEHDEGDSGAVAPVDSKKRAVLLSCSHVFHHGCLLSFERFALANSALDGGAHAPHSTWSDQQRALEALTDASQREYLCQPPPACLCPLCRANYQKTWM